MKLLLSILILAPLMAFAGHEKFRRTIKENLKEISACYKETLNKDPKAAGKIVLTWSIDDKGTVTKSSINENSTTLKDSGLQSCILTKLNSWKFPAAPHGEVVEINYPFSFSPGDLK